MSDSREEEPYRRIFRLAHAEHRACAADEWLSEPCRAPDGAPAERSVVWSRRNGPWARVDVLFVGAAPGNAGGMGSGPMGAHATRIPFGGDIAGGNLDVLLSSAGLDRNSTFIVAALNQLPDRGGGEPRVSELRAPVGALPSSLHLLRETVLAAAPRLVVSLGNVALRAVAAAATLAGTSRLTLPSLPGLEAAGLSRGSTVRWPTGLAADPAFSAALADRSGDGSLPALLWLLHPSAQNMSPYAGKDTVFHARMVETVAALREAVSQVLGWSPPAERPPLPHRGIYALPEWRDAVGPRHAELDRLWRERGV
jgi:uracil-DNA glycosylase